MFCKLLPVLLLLILEKVILFLKLKPYLAPIPNPNPNAQSRSICNVNINMTLQYCVAKLLSLMTRLLVIKTKLWLELFELVVVVEFPLLGV